MNEDLHLSQQPIRTLRHFLPDSAQLVWDQGITYEQEAESILNTGSPDDAINKYIEAIKYKKQYLAQFSIIDRPKQTASLTKTIIVTALVAKNMGRPQYSRYLFGQALVWTEKLMEIQEYTTMAHQNLEQIHKMLEEIDKMDCSDESTGPPV